MHRLVEDGFEEITFALFHCHYYAVQARMERKIRFLAKNYGEALRRHGIDPEDLLRSLCDETSADGPASQDRN